jgi:hypothetical protein
VRDQPKKFGVRGVKVNLFQIARAQKYYLRNTNFFLENGYSLQKGEAVGTPFMSIRFLCIPVGRFGEEFPAK